MIDDIEGQTELGPRSDEVKSVFLFDEWIVTDLVKCLLKS